MLSVLIPVYNTDVRHFVQQFITQLDQLGVEGEILCLDDASQEEYKLLNRETGTWKYVKYKELDTNHGRSRIRNLLAETARYDWLLFVDGDSEICDPLYLKKYLEHTQDKNRLIYGGTAYGPKPAAAGEYLHWYYGKQRECINARERNTNKFGTFKTNNFLVHRELFRQVKFNENVKGYGHEDTLFAQDLERKGFDILHIENPLQHNGLETNAVFIGKQKNAMDNLVKLYRQNLISDEIRLVRFYHTVKKWRLLWLVKLLYLKNEETLRKNLLSGNPKLGNLDRLKMGWFLEAMGDRRSFDRS